MSFRKNAYLLGRKQSMFGKNIIITDNNDWTTADIIQASLDRWQVEDQFRLSKDKDLVGASPVRHWTDSKIRCHLFTCVAAMTYLRRIELVLAATGKKRTAADIMEEMRHLHHVLSLRRGARKPDRRLETPSRPKPKSYRRSATVSTRVGSYNHVPPKTTTDGHLRLLLTFISETPVKVGNLTQMLDGMVRRAPSMRLWKKNKPMSQ